MSFDSTGTIIFIGQTAQVTDKFRKRGIAIRTEDKYPQQCIFQMIGDRCAVLDNYKLGDRVQIIFTLQGRVWNKAQDGKLKYFNALNIVSIQLLPDKDDPQEKQDLEVANDFMDNLQPTPKAPESPKYDDLPF